MAYVNPRDAIASAYPYGNGEWRRRVDSMPDRQVWAIYNRIFGNKKEKKSDSEYRQFDLSDYGIDLGR